MLCLKNVMAFTLVAVGAITLGACSADTTSEDPESVASEIRDDNKGMGGKDSTDGKGPKGGKDMGHDDGWDCKDGKDKHGRDCKKDDERSCKGGKDKDGKSCNGEHWRDKGPRHCDDKGKCDDHKGPPDGHDGKTW